MRGKRELDQKTAKDSSGRPKEIWAIVQGRQFTPLCDSKNHIGNRAMRYHEIDAALCRRLLSDRYSSLRR